MAATRRLHMEYNITNLRAGVSCQQQELPLNISGMEYTYLLFLLWSHLVVSPVSVKECGEMKSHFRHGATWHSMSEIISAMELG